MPTVLVTGASRGLGLEHARQYAEQGWQVLAGARRGATAGPLAALAASHPGRVQPLKLDVTAAADVATLGVALGGKALDLLINNAGTYGPQGAPEGMAYQSLAHMDYDIWREILEVNLLGPFRLTTALLPGLRRARRPVVVMMSSDLGSITQNAQGGSYAYRSSKAALNMIARGLAVECPELICIAMAPGWVRTDLGGRQAPLEAVDSVRAQQQVIGRLTAADSGRFVNRFGDTVPW